MADLAWTGRLTAFNVPSVDGWIIDAPPTADVPHTSLPLPLKYQRTTAGGHDNAEVGLAKIDEVTSDGGYLLSAGTFDENDPEARLLASKVDRGYINQVSVDLVSCSVQASGDHHRVTNWLLSSATLVADPKFHAARIGLSDGRTLNSNDAPSHELAASTTSLSMALPTTGIAMSSHSLVTAHVTAQIDELEIRLSRAMTIIDLHTTRGK